MRTRTAGFGFSQVHLPNGSLHNQTRFPLNGAKKVWAVCAAAVTQLRVTLSDA